MGFLVKSVMRQRSLICLLLALSAVVSCGSATSEMPKEIASKCLISADTAVLIAKGHIGLADQIRDHETKVSENEIFYTIAIRKDEAIPNDSTAVARSGRTVFVRKSDGSLITNERKVENGDGAVRSNGCVISPETAVNIAKGSLLFDYNLVEYDSDVTKTDDAYEIHFYKFDSELGKNFGPRIFIGSEDGRILSVVHSK